MMRIASLISYKHGNNAVWVAVAHRTLTLMYSMLKEGRSFVDMPIIPWPATWQSPQI
jgi:hypothetical protein